MGNTQRKRFLLALLLLGLFACAFGCGARQGGLSAAGAVVINEAVSSNKNSLVDKQLGSPDWIELYNASDAPADLSGWGLSDSVNDLHGFTFPEGTVLGAHEYLVVYASGNDGAERTDRFCTDFGLSRSGDMIILTDAYYGLIQQLALPALYTDVSYARDASGAYGYCALPTPGAENDTPISSDLDALFAARDANKPILTEVLPAGDEAGGPWAELYNAGEAAIRLDGYYLSDSPNNPMRWQLPPATLGAGAYVCVRLDGEEDAEDGIHAGFSLGKNDTCVTLADLQGNVISELSWQQGLPRGVAVVRTEEGARYTAFPTFGEENSARTFEHAEITDMDARDAVRLSEALPHNTQSAVDTDGDRSEWVELHNASDRELSLLGYYLSDRADEPFRWALPDVKIPAGGYRMVFLSGKDRTAGELHASFRLGDGEAAVYLTDLDGLRRDSLPVGDVARDNVSVGRDAGGNVCYYAYPTPERANAQGFSSADEIGCFNPHGVFISEVSAAGAPKSGENDWIELYNGGEEAVDLTGWYLSDDPDAPKKWQLPPRTLRSHRYTVISASSHTPRQGERVAAFGVRNGGETLLLSDTEGNVIDRFDTGVLKGGVTSGRIVDNADIPRVFFTTPTRSFANAIPAGDGYAPTPAISETGLYHDAPFSVTLSCREEGAQIFYTLDGSVPDETDAMYSGEPIEIEKNTVLRAVGVLSGKLPSAPATATYLFETPHAVPVVCINGEPKDVKAVLRVKSQANKIEREAVIAYYEADGTLGTAFPAGIRPKGASTIVNAQKSLSIHLRAGYGQSAVTYPFFKDAQVSTFSTLAVRNGGQDWERANLRDAFCQRLVAGMHLDAVQTRPVVVYINGAYYGLYDLREDQNEDYLKTHYGVDTDLANIVKRNETPLAGSADDFIALRRYALEEALFDDDRFQSFAERIDVAYFTDYLIAETYVCNSDFFNQKYWRTTDGTVKWRPIFFDLDYGFRNKAAHDILPSYFKEDGVPSANGTLTYVEIYIGLNKNAAWRRYAAERYVECVMTYFDPDRAAALLDEMATAIRPEMPRQLAHWGKPANMDAWEREVEQIRTLLYERQQPALENMRRFFGLSREELDELILQYTPSTQAAHSSDQT